MKKIIEKVDLICLAAASVVFYIIQWKILETPLHHDEVISYGKNLFDLYQKGVGQFLNPDAFYNHPPGMHLIPYLVFSIFGDSIFVLRFLSVGLITGAAWCLYFIGRHHVSRSFGLACFLAFLFSQNLFGQAHMYLADTTFIIFGLMYVYFSSRQWFLATFSLGIYIGLFREYSLAFGIMVLIDHILKRDINKRSFLMSIAPFIGLFVFWVYEKIVIGQSFSHPAYSDFTLEHLDIFWIGRVFSGFYINESRWLYSVVMVIGLILLLLIKKKLPKCYFLIPFALINGIFFLTFVFDRGFVDHYTLPIFPLYIMSALYPLFIVMKKKIFLILPLLIYYQASQSGNFMTDGYVLKVWGMKDIEIFREAVSEIERKESPLICTNSWVFPRMLENPSFGWVKKKILATDNIKSKFDFFALVMVYGDEEEKRQAERLIENEGLVLYKRISRKNKEEYLSLYQRTKDSPQTREK